MVRRSRAFRLVSAARLIAGAAALTMLACMRSPSSSPSPSPSPPTGVVRPPNAADARLARVSLGTMASVRLSAAAGWQLRDRDGRVVVEGDGASRPALALASGRIRIDGGAGGSKDVDGPLAFSSRGGAPVAVNQRRYRGDLVIVAADSALRVVNR